MWIDPEWDARTKAVLMKLLDRNAKANEDTRSWKQECAKANIKVEANIAELQKVKRDLGDQQVRELTALQKANKSLDMLDPERHDQVKEDMDICKPLLEEENARLKKENALVLEIIMKSRV